MGMENLRRVMAKDTALVIVHGTMLLNTTEANGTLINSPDVLSGVGAATGVYTFTLRKTYPPLDSTGTGHCGIFMSLEKPAGATDCQPQLISYNPTTGVLVIKLFKTSDGTTAVAGVTGQLLHFAILFNNLSVTK